MTDYFRGYHAIKEVVDYMQPLAEWMQKFKPGTHVMTLKGPDFDLLKRWPKAEQILGVTQDSGVMRFMGFELKRDHKASRYPAKQNAVSP
jgi:hypothetical protein